ncbi:MAG TPA: alpha/beta hydrolase [Acetobacteraceae bacterium]
MATIRTPAVIERFRSEIVTVDGVRLHYWIGGDPAGQPVILWHGFLSTGYAWRHVAPALAQAGMAVLIPDMRGYGDSDKPSGTEGYDARALAEECRALVRETGVGGGRPLLIAAHDMGAPPALLWAADHPEEVAGLLYIEAPVMLGQPLREVIAYTPVAMAHGSMWWWILPLAPGVPERLVVGHERGFLTWFYEGATARPEAFDPATIDEYLRSFSGREGVLGAMGVYRAAFTSIGQTEPLAMQPIATPIVALGGKKGLGDAVGTGVRQVARTVTAETLAGCGHFVPEECPDAVIRHIRSMAANLS